MISSPHLEQCIDRRGENGVALAAIEKLYQSNLAKDRQIEDLKAASADRLKTGLEC